ncbi:MAG: cation:proton antiporter [Thiolinea sp.]
MPPPLSSGDEHGGSLISNLPGWQQTLIVIGVVAAIILAGRFLTRPLFRFIADSGLREIFTATALLLVIGIALLMQTVGLSPALGAFVAGVVLADSEYRHELEANIDPFKALLLGFFFISVGASIDFGLLAAQPLLIGVLVTGLITVKFAILWALAQRFGLHQGDRYWFAFALAQGGEFGFVLLSFALQNRVLPTDTAAILTVAIALSMVLTPILILLNERLIQPRFESRANPDMAEETIEEQDNPVIIAGFGRFGQIVGRMLISNGIPVTVMDRSPSQIEQVRQFGFKVFYGDVSREELLHAAGAHKAKLLIITVGNRDSVDRIIETAQRHFPHLKIYTRAYDVLHYHRLKNRKVDHIERELFHSSLKMGEQCLQGLGMRAYQARRAAVEFARHDEKVTAKIGEHIDDSKQNISTSTQARAEVLELLQADLLERRQHDDHHAWDAIGHD